jgi:hypothetical protein
MTGARTLSDRAKNGAVRRLLIGVALICGTESFERIKENKMRILAFAIAAAFALGLPASVPAKAEETTIVKKHRDFDNDRAKVIIKKKEEPRSKKVIIHKDY